MPDTVTMYDSVPQAWPKGAKYIAAYVDGRYSSNYAAAKATGATVVSISVRGADADVGDVESGCLWPNSAGAAWAKGQLARRPRTTLYTFAANWQPLRNACANAGVELPRVDWWVAQWDGQAVVPAGAVAKQYHSDNQIDISVALASWYALAPLGAPPAPIAPTEVPALALFIKTKDGKVYEEVQDGKATYWRPWPAPAAAKLPAAWLVEDDGTLLAMWKVGASS